MANRKSQIANGSPILARPTLRALPPRSWPHAQSNLRHRFPDDFLDTGLPHVDAQEAGFAQGAHAVLAASVAELVERDLGNDQVAEVVVHDGQLVDAHAALVAGVVALFAALAIEPFLGGGLLGGQAQLHDDFLTGREFGSAEVAD